MSNPVEQILIGAAGNAVGGPPGQLAGFGLVKLLRGRTITSKRDKAEAYMSEMLQYIDANRHLLSLEEREDLHQIEDNAKASKEMSLEKEWYYERYLAASEFKDFAKGGKIKAKQLSEDAKRAHLQRLTALERAEANAAAQQTNITVPERAHTDPSAADRPSGHNPVASGSDNDPQGSMSYPPSRASKSVRFSVQDDPFRTPTASLTSLASTFTYNSMTFLDPELDSLNEAETET